MKLSSVIGYGIVILLGGILVQARARYLERASRAIQAGNSFNVELKPAIWAYAVPALSCGMGIVIAILGFVARKQPGIVLAAGIAASMFLAGAWWFRNLLGARLIISQGTLVWTEGKEKAKIAVDEVAEVSIYWFYFQVDLRNGKRLLIPATFQSSEIVLAFLRWASQKNARAAGGTVVSAHEN